MDAMEINRRGFFAKTSGILAALAGCTGDEGPDVRIEYEVTVERGKPVDIG